MKHSLQNSKKAREMRLFGLSLSEIHKETSIPISTLSSWLGDITLNEAQSASLKERVSSSMKRGRFNSSIAIRSKRVFQEKKAFDEAEREFSTHSNDPFFMTGLSLYWASGARKGSSFQFSNSDKSMISVMNVWIKKYLDVDDSLIRHKKYNGYSRIVICRISALRKMVAWQKLLIQYYSVVVS